MVAYSWEYKMKIFEVVKLKNGDKATIIEIKANSYKAAIFDVDGTLKGHKYITNQDIDDIIYSKEY